MRETLVIYKSKNQADLKYEKKIDVESKLYL